jgi:hypothetical protein
MSDMSAPTGFLFSKPLRVQNAGRLLEGSAAIASPLR